MQVWPARTIRLHLGIAIAIASVGLVGVALAAWPWLSAGVTAGLGGLWYLWMAGRYHRRRALVAQPFPEAWQKILTRRVNFYREFDDDDARRRFEDDVRIFLAEQRIYGAGEGEHQLEIGDETRLLIAASAAILSHGIPNFEWPRMRDIVVHPRAFNEDYGSEHPTISGMVHYQGPILYSERDLRHGFRRHDGHNVGLHELAHVLDLADGHADGVPVGASWASSAPWLAIVSDRLAKLREDHYPHVLRDYAATNEAEFFAVAVEAFFEKPRQMQGKHAELYELLKAYFRQDPAARRGRSPTSSA